MAPSENSFTDNMSAVDRIYATHARVGEKDEDGNVSVPHIDVDNENMDGEPVNVANVGVPTEFTTTPETEAAVANPDVDEPAVVPVDPDGDEDPDPDVDPDDLTEEELEELTDPDGEQA